MQNCIAPLCLPLQQRMRALRAAALALACATLPLAAQADGKIYRCTDHGQVTFQDGPCGAKQGFWPPFVAPEGNPVAKAAPATTTLAARSGSGTPPVGGEWRGQTQYQGSENGQYLQGSQSVVPLAISLTQDGKVTGDSSENGCHVLGIWGPGVSPNVAALDVTLNGCSHASFNRRYSGFLTAGQDLRTAQLSLQAYDPGSGRTTRLYDVKSTLRR